MVKRTPAFESPASARCLGAYICKARRSGAGSRQTGTSNHQGRRMDALHPSDGQPPTPQADQQVDLLTHGGGIEFLCIACIVSIISSGCMAMQECQVCLTTIWRRYYEAELEQLRSAGSAIWTRAKERSWSSTASKTTRDFFLRVLEYLFRAMYEKNQCALEYYTGGLFANADLDQSELDYTADVNTMVQGCVEQSTRVACQHFLQVVWKRLMRGNALRRVFEAWTEQVEEALLFAGMLVEDVRAAARTIELRTLNTKWCHNALEKFLTSFRHDMDHIPESIVTALLVDAPRFWTDEADLLSFERSSVSSIMDAVNERQSRADFVAETSLVANGMGMNPCDGVPSNLASAGQGIKIAMARYQPGTVKCHAKICADGAWKADLVRAYEDKICDEFKLQDAVRALTGLSPGFVPPALSSRDCSFTSPAV
jgi:hypothetical protein